jgi:hypothetical protein
MEYLDLFHRIGGMLYVFCSYVFFSRVIKDEETGLRRGFKLKYLIWIVLFGWIPIANLVWGTFMFYISFIEMSVTNQIKWPNRMGNWFASWWDRRLF